MHIDQRVSASQIPLANGNTMDLDDLDVGLLFLVHDGRSWLVSGSNSVARAALARTADHDSAPELGQVMPADAADEAVWACETARMRPGDPASAVYVHEGRRWRFSARAPAAQDAQTLTVTLVDLGPVDLPTDSDLPSITHSAIFQSVDLGVAIAGPDRRLLWVNRGFSRLFGWAYDAVVNQALGRILPPWDRARIFGQFEAALAEQGPRQPFTAHIRCVAGSSLEVLVTANQLKLADGRVFVVTTFTDVADRKRLEQDLLQARRAAEAANLAKSHFLETISHELRTPLNAILGFSEIMDQELFGPIGDAHYTTYVRDIRRSGTYLLELINDILDLSRVEAGHAELAIAPLNLRQIVGETVGLFTAQAAQKSLDLSTDIPDTMPTLFADDRAMRQVLSNLVSNAVKFTREAGTIRVVCRDEDNMIRITVTDTGIGIPADQLETVLKPFERGRDQEVRLIQGTGLGLPLVVRLVEAHGGRFELDSTRGVGTTATVRFRTRWPFVATLPHRGSEESV